MSKAIIHFGALCIHLRPEGYIITASPLTPAPLRGEGILSPCTAQMRGDVFGLRKPNPHHKPKQNSV